MSMFPIATASPTTGGIIFSSIPQTFTHLQLRVFLRSTNTGVQDFNYTRFNSDSSASYVAHDLVGDGASASSSYYNARSYNWLTDIPGGTSTANLFGNAVIDILDYTNTNKYKTVRSIGGYDANGSGTVQLASGLYMSTNAITTIQCEPGNAYAAAGSVVCLYGIQTSNATGA